MSRVLKTNKSVLIGGALVAGLGLAAIATESFAEQALTVTWTCSGETSPTYNGTNSLADKGVVTEVSVDDQDVKASYEFKFVDDSGNPSPDAGSGLAVTNLTFNTTDGDGNTFQLDGYAFSLPLLADGTDQDTEDIDFEFVNCSTVAIAPAPLEAVGILADDKTFDGDRLADIDFSADEDFSGTIYRDDQVSLVPGNVVGLFDTRNVGTNKDVTVTGLTLSNSNYELLDVIVQADITQADPVTITASDETKTYGDVLGNSDFGFSVDEASGLQKGDTIDSVFATVENGSSDNGKLDTADVGNYTITLSGASGDDGMFQASNYSNVVYVDATLTVTPATLDFTATNQSKTYGNDTPLLQGEGSGLGFTVSGLVNGDTLTGECSVTVSVDGLDTDTGATVREDDDITLAADCSSSTNYQVGNETSGLYDIDPRFLEVTVSDDASHTKVYGQVVSDITGSTNFSITDGDYATGESISSVTLRSDDAFGEGADVDTHNDLTIISYVGDGGFLESNYAITVVAGSFDVTPKPVTINGGTITKTYGDEITASDRFSGETEFSHSALVDQDDISSIALVVSSSEGLSGNSAVGGDYDFVIDDTSVQLSQGNINNYSFTAGTSGDLDVVKRQLTVSGVDVEKFYGDEYVFQGDEFQVTGLAEGDDIVSVQFSSFGVAANAKAGTVDITFDEDDFQGNDSFDLNNYTVPDYSDGAAQDLYWGTLTIKPAPLVIEVDSETKTYGDVPEWENTVVSRISDSQYFDSWFTITGLKLNDAINEIRISSAGSASDAGIAPTPLIDAEIVSVNTDYDPENYNVDIREGRLTITARVLTIEARDLTKTEGETLDLSGLGSSSVRVNGFAPSSDHQLTSVSLSSEGAGSAAAAGEYDLEVVADSLSFSGSDFDVNNYNLVLNENTGTLTVEAVVTPPSSGGGGGTIIVQAPIVTDSSASASSGEEITLSGANLNLVRSVTVGGVDATIVSSTATSITISVPELDGGSASIVLSYLGGQIEYASILTVEATEDEDSNDESNPATETNYWTTALSESEIKMYAKNIIGLGKVQFFHNGQEVAWVRAEDATDPKLRVIESGPMEGANYLVRTRTLVPGKNVFEIYVDGVRVERRAQTF